MPSPQGFFFAIAESFRASLAALPFRLPDLQECHAAVDVEQGMHPDEVGELVATAIAERKFWILTHPRWAKGVQNQLDALREDQTLTRA